MTPAARGAMTKAILQKMQRLASVSGFVIGTASPVQRPPAARLCQAPPDRGSHPRPGRQVLRQHLRPPGRAGLATKPEPMAIGDAREHGADATLSSLSCEQNSYFGRY